MKRTSAIGFAFMFVLTMAMMGCARDRVTGAGAGSSCCGANNSVGQNDAMFSSGDDARIGMTSGSTGDNTVKHKFCPVTGEPLDSMGGAIPVNANGQTIFVCCKGCVKTVQKDPAKYLAIARAE